MNNLIKAYYINLDRSKHRKRLFLKQSKKSTLKVERFSAIDGKKVLYKHINKNIINNIPKKRLSSKIGGRLATFISHVAVWRRFLVKDIRKKYLLVLEDDCILPTDFDQRLKNVLNTAPSNWDFIYLFYNRKLVGHKKGNFVKPSPIFKKGYNTGFVSYIIKRSTIQKIVKAIYPINLNVPDINIDHYIKRFYHQFNFYFTKNKIVYTNRNIKSDRLS